MGAGFRQDMTVDVAANMRVVEARIARAAQAVGRDPGEILLVAVSKAVDIGRIAQAIAAGVSALGENRVQEAKEKIARLGHPVPWHLVGTLQTNKVRDALRLFDVVHSVDRLELAREVDRRARAEGKVMDVLVQVNVAGEPTKAGFTPDELKPALEAITAFSALRVLGLMTLPPPVEDPEEARPWFRQLRELRDQAGLVHLSMGMTGDFEVAIEEGATMVRVGTAIFGPRPSPKAISAR
ncbi:MAG: YggS family pyridoxal phosphate-dependent enzyme [Candidatus Methylomirabilia bacterium]